MPYKDPERKKQWERLHRPERVARRRELRRIETVQSSVTRPEKTIKQHGEAVAAASFLVPLAIGGTLTALNPELGMGLGGLTLVIAAIYKKGWQWWIVGIIVLVMALLLYFEDRNGDGSRSFETK